MSDSVHYTCSSGQSITSNKSESPPPQKVRIRGNRKTSPTPTLATSSDYEDHGNKTKERCEQQAETTHSKFHKGSSSESDKESTDDINLLKEAGTERFLNTRTSHAATLVPSPATATSPQPLRIYNSTRFTQNTPTTNVVSTHKAHFTGAPLLIRDKNHKASRQQE